MSSSIPPVTFRIGRLSGYLAPLDGCPDLEALAQSLPPQEPVVWLDSARLRGVTGRWSMVGCRPWLTCRMASMAPAAHDDRIRVRTSEGERVWGGHPLESLRRVLRSYSGVPEVEGQVGDDCLPPIRRAVGLMGFLSYEMNRWIERLPLRVAKHPSVPVLPQMLWFGMRIVVIVDHLAQRSWLVSIADPHAPRRLACQEALEALHRTEACMAAELREEGSVSQQEPPSESGGALAEEAECRLEPTSTQAEFEAMVCRILEHIHAGDIFQANLAQRFTGAWTGSSHALYRTLRRVNPSPFSCFLSSEDLTVISSSPERLVCVDGGRISTRPIAGTRPRGMTPEDDAINSFDLLMNEKERAEHIMLVDLARNDVGRVCASGTVKVGELMGLEEYSHVIHIVSDVAGTLRPGVDGVDVIRAVFPGGTITGCPKVRCMEILQAIEPCERGLYTGSLGYLGFDGTLDLNIAIRTIVRSGDQLSFHVGAGIVADSVPEREYHETLAKAGALMQALRVVGARSASVSR